jgi:S-adenosylmethionine:tRNA ribosyltransferase-isomerase
VAASHPDHAIGAYDYDLPAELIAQEPLAERDASRLLVLERASGRLAHHRFHELAELLRPDDLLVLNRSRVFPARLLGTRPGGGTAELLLVRQRGPELWEAMLRPARRLRPGMIVDIAPGFRARVEDEPAVTAGASGSSRAAGPTATRLVRLLADEIEPAALIERHGHVPLPPYIRRPDRPADRERYQTVFAREAGSVAAPTAGLHFTPALLDRLRARGIETASVVLHVGPGTFRPVEVDDVRAHRVPPERFTIPEETASAIERAHDAGRRVVAVGTTSTRALESRTDGKGHVLPGDGETDLVIVPGFRFRTVDALVTNFHLPRSSLLLLVSAFGGRERVLAAYQTAVAERYRFYSYGDAMLMV